MMGIEVPETCCEYHKCKKSIQWHLVGFSSLRIGLYLLNTCHITVLEAGNTVINGYIFSRSTQLYEV